MSNGMCVVFLAEWKIWGHSVGDITLQRNGKIEARDTPTTGTI